MRCRALPYLAVLALLVAGCGSEDGGSPSLERKDETADKLPQLPSGFEEFVNRDGGVAFGRPPGWAANAKGATTTLTAPDGLVAATITVDRTDDALELEPKDFAIQTAELVPGYKEPLEPSRAKPLKHEYESAIVEAEGTSEKDGLKQIVRVIVLERKGVAVVTAVIAENAEKEARFEASQILETISTLRTRPPA